MIVIGVVMIVAFVLVFVAFCLVIVIGVVMIVAFVLVFAAGFFILQEVNGIADVDGVGLGGSNCIINSRGELCKVEHDIRLLHVGDLLRGEFDPVGVSTWRSKVGDLDVILSDFGNQVGEWVEACCDGELAV